MNKACKECGGACCKTIALDFGDIHPELRKWLECHVSSWDKTRYEFPIPCRRLEKGKCSIYESRPEVCKVFEVGSDDCLMAIKRYGRNVHKVLQLIKEESDGK